MPLAPERYALQCTISRSTREKLERAQALLSHQIAPGDLPTVIDRALDALIEQLEKRKFGRTSNPRPQTRRKTTQTRHIPAEIKRRVYERDHGRCTFVSEKGQRCPEKCRLEFDHIEPFARGGMATVGGLRLRCRAHNQYEAERIFGVQFMNHRRTESRRAAAMAREASVRGTEATGPTCAPVQAPS